MNRFMLKKIDNYIVGIDNRIYDVFVELVKKGIDYSKFDKNETKNLFSSVCKIIAETDYTQYNKSLNGQGMIWNDGILIMQDKEIIPNDNTAEIDRSQI